jgi:N-acetylneuraminic acid mutarotase
MQLYRRQRSRVVRVLRVVEPLESRRLLHGDAAFDLHVNFQPSGAAVPSGYVADTGATFAARGNGFTSGWDASASGATRDRNSSRSPDQRYDTFVHTQMYGTRTWEVAVPNGDYVVHLVGGDPDYYGSTIKFNAEGVLVASGSQTSANKWVEGEATVTVSDGKLTITNASGASNNKLSFLDITSAEPTSSPPPPPPPPSGSFTAKINFQPSSATTPAGYFADIGSAFGSRGNGLSYGWSATNTAYTRDRNASLSPDQRYDTLNHFKVTRWELAVPASGTYTVRVVVGDPSYIDSVYGLDAEGATIVGGTPSASQHWFEATAKVNVTDGRLTLTNSAGSSNNRICFIEVTGDTVVTPPPTQSNTIAWTTGLASPVPRSEAMVANVDNKMFVFGGYLNNTFTPTNRVDAYDPVANSWTRLSDSDMIAAVTHAGSAVLGRSVVIAGGYPVGANNAGQSFSTKVVQSYNVDTHAWTRLPDLPAARGGGALVNLNGTLHFFGGSDANRKDANTHWSLAPGAAAWATDTPLPTLRNHLGAVAYAGKIYAIGGQQGQDAAEVPQSAVEVYDPATRQWTAKAPLPFGRSHIAASTLVVDNRIVVLGGEKTFNSVVNNVSAYDPATDSWSEMTALPQTRNSGVAAYINGQLIYSTGRFATTTYRGTIG